MCVSEGEGGESRECEELSREDRYSYLICKVEERLRNAPKTSTIALPNLVVLRKQLINMIEYHGLVQA